MRAIIIEPSPIPYHRDKLYYVQLIRLDTKVTDPFCIAAYRNGECLGYGFSIKAK